MKNLLVVCLILFSVPVYSAVLTGGVEYSTEDARIELQNSRPYGIDYLLINSHIKDNNNKENNSYLLKGVTKLTDRTLAKFSDGTYGVNYKNDPMHVWYYDSHGNLINTEIKSSLNYPYKTYKYSTDGELVTMTMRVSEKETFIFDPIGQLLAHWIGPNCYDSSGNILMTREIFK